MKEITYAYTHRYGGKSSDSRSVAFSFGVSICLHLLFFSALLFVPAPTPRPGFSSGVVRVSLVSLPAEAPGLKAGGQPVATAKQEAKKPAKAKVSDIMPPPKKPVAVLEKPAEAISLAPKPKEKTSLKKKTIDRHKVIKSAIQQVQKKVDESDSASLKAALDRLREKVEESEATNPPSNQISSTKGDSTEIGSGAGTASGVGQQAIEAIKIYQAEIQYRIQKNWAFSQQLAGESSELEAVLAIKILPNGEIEKIWFDKKSGNAYLDESAYKAIVKSNPLPPLPREYMGPFYKIGLIFGPKGLK